MNVWLVVSALMFGLTFAILRNRSKIDDIVSSVKKELDKRHCTHADCKGNTNR